MPADVLDQPSCIQQINSYYDEQYDKHRRDEHRYDIEKARAIVVAYTLFYWNDGLETLGIERPLCLPIYDPSTDTPIEADDAYYSGIVDALYRKDFVKLFGDHKTVTKLDDSYWYELLTNPQLTHYLLAARQMGIDVGGFLWDVLLKPGISPKDMTKKAVKEIELDGTYCGQPLTRSYNGEERETPYLYGLRVLVEYTENPSKYFHRKTLQRSDGELLEYVTELAAKYREMKRWSQTKETSFRNLSACKSFGSLCEYHQLCSGSVTEDGNMYHVPEKTPNDRDPEKIMKPGALSPSRLACADLCRRKFYYKYVLKLEKRRKEYNTHLEFGTLVHSGLEIFLHSRMVPKDEQVSFKPYCEKAA